MVHCISSSEPDTSDLRESNGKNQFDNLSDIQSEYVTDFRLLATILLICFP